MTQYAVAYERPNGDKGLVLTNEESGPCVVEYYKTPAEAEEVVREMQRDYGYTGLKYSVEEIECIK